MNLYKNKRKKGYTLAEVLITVTILLILMAIAVPAIFSIRKNLRQKALDNKAELIYTAVQNNLVKLQNNGNSAEYATDKATPLRANPADADGDKQSVLYYVTAADKENTKNAASVLVTKDAIDDDLYSHYWVVEYNPSSASVYAVFYSETRSNDYDTVTYNSLRYKKNRLKEGAQVGYYGGDMIDGGNTSTLAPKLTITNGEKLEMKISCKRPDDGALSFEIKLEDEQKHSLTLKYKPNTEGTAATGFVHEKDDLFLDNQQLGQSGSGSTTTRNETGSILGVRYELKLTLDDLTEEAVRFNNLYGNGNNQLTDASHKLTPGSPLKITVTVKSASTTIDSVSVSAKTNSLFGDDTNNDTAILLYGRHLQNLDQSSGVSGGITNAIQKSDIHFEKTDDLDDGKEDLTSWYSCYQNKTFIPITNTNLKSYISQAPQSESGSTGKSVAPAIYHLTIENQEKAGLFATLPEGMTVDSVRLAGTRITGKAGADASAELVSDVSSAGALAGGTAGAATITNCQVFLEQEDLKGKTADDFWITGAAIQGGLVGKTGNGKVTISNSFAATVMGSKAENTVAGGLIGMADGEVSITHSYADSYITGSRVGGLLAKADKDQITVSVDSCYTAGYLKPTQIGGGLIGETKTPTQMELKNSYTAVSWVSSSSSADQENQESSVTRYSAAQFGANCVNVYFLNGGTDYTSDTTAEGQKWSGEKIDYKSLSSNRAAVVTKLGTAFTASASVTNPYNLKNQGLSGYSYPALTELPHYGDWEASFEAGSLVYYEVYADDAENSYGFYGGNVPSTLRNDLTIVGDGYGIAYEENEVPDNEITVIYQSLASQSGEAKDTKTEEKTIKFKSDTKYKVTVGTKQYVVVPLPKDVVNEKAIPDTYYQKLTVQGEAAVGNQNEESDNVINGSVFYYNPHFAKTVINSSEGANAPEVPKEISLRTARQLHDLSLYYPDYEKQTANSTFSQECDIDYTAYRWTEYTNETAQVTVQEPIGARGKTITDFRSGYNGNCHKIYGISFSTSASAVGFIGNNSKTLQNVFLVSDYQENGVNPYLQYARKDAKGQAYIGANQKVYMGALAGKNSGRIANCAVSGYTVSGTNRINVKSNGTVYFGGLVGSNCGTITGCEADTPLVNAEILYGYAYLGGFAGENASGGRIRNCYAIGHVMVEDAKGGKTVISGFTANNAGSISSSYCAAALTASGAKTSSYGFSPKGGSISNCSYLSGGTFSYAGALYAFDNASGGGTKKSYKEMTEGITESAAECHSATASEMGYPFQTVVKNGNGTFVHFGNWETRVDLGGIGVLYWEKEEGGSNDGYHFSYLGYKKNEQDSTGTLDRTQGSTLCRQHDDGGIVTEYGYGYYYANVNESSEGFTENSAEGTGIPEQSTKDFQTGAENSKVSAALTSRLPGFTVVAYTTRPAIQGKAASGQAYMQMTASPENNDSQIEQARQKINGVWTFTYQGLTYKFTINPFFANSMQYGTATESGIPSGITVNENGTPVGADSVKTMPGTASSCEYEIRSIDQLQYMNWNCVTQDGVTSITGKDTVKTVQGYTYLGYMYSTYSGWNNNKRTNIVKNAKYYWNQSHDVDAAMTPGSVENIFVSVGSLYDSKGGESVAVADAYMAYLNGNYDGNTYSIKNVEINSTGTAVGLFGSIIGANVSNVILYSDKGNYIQRSVDSPKTWYVMGGLCGLAAAGQEAVSGSAAAITNCTVSGYNIQDNSTKSAWGDACVGGMFGMSTLNLEKCTAVNKIIVNTVYTNGEGRKSDGVSVRVGGLVGSMRGTINACYTGGEITCTAACLENAKNGWGAHLFLSGISGGVCFKSGNFLALLGDKVQGVLNYQDDTNRNAKPCTTPATILKNCYTYIKMPIDSANIRSIEPIGSNGETHDEKADNYHVRVQIINCYYYAANMPTIKHENLNGKNWSNIDDTAVGLTWKEFAGVDPDKASLLKHLGNDFSTVTTEVNNQSVDGKYSFTGTRTDLEGENYPFPTILKQGEINVHYGEWPREGIYWEESRASMDIFEDLQLEGDNKDLAIKTFKLLDPKPVLATDLDMNSFTITYSSGEKDSDTLALSAVGIDEAEGFSDSPQETAEEGFLSETETIAAVETDEIAEIINIRYDQEAKCYLATIKALKTGATTITVSATGTDNQTYTASFNLNVSADLSVYAEPASVNQKLGESKEITLHAVPASQVSSDNTNAVVENDNTNTAVVQSSDGWVADDLQETPEMDTSAPDGFAEAGSAEIEEDGFQSDVYDVDVQSSSAEEMEVFASDSQAALKDIAGKMQWEIIASEDGPLTVTKVTNGKFTVTSHAISNITLTITGTYSYNNIDYTVITWIDVITTEENNETTDPGTTSSDTTDSEITDSETTISGTKNQQSSSDTSFENNGFADNADFVDGENDWQSE